MISYNSLKKPRQEQLSDVLKFSDKKGQPMLSEDYTSYCPPKLYHRFGDKLILSVKILENSQDILITEF